MHGNRTTSEGAAWSPGTHASAIPERDSAASEVVRRELDFDRVPYENPHVVLPDLARNRRQHLRHEVEGTCGPPVVRAYSRARRRAQSSARQPARQYRGSVARNSGNVPPSSSAAARRGTWRWVDSRSPGPRACRSLWKEEGERSGYRYERAPTAGEAADRVAQCSSACGWWWQVPRLRRL